MTQTAVAQATGIDQGDISRLERRASFDGVELSTLRRYVEAVGGRLAIVADFPKGHRIEIVPAADDQDQEG